MSIKLLEGVGVFKKAMSSKRRENYQASVTAPLDRCFDDDVGGDDEEEEDGDLPALVSASDTDVDELSKAVGKVNFDSDSDDSYVLIKM
jgi:hypothetical protein